MADRRTLRVAVLDDYQDAAARFLPTAALAEACDLDLHIYTSRAADQEELIRRVGSAEVVVAMRERSALPAEVIAELAETRLIITSGARNRVIDHEAAADRGIAVCGTRGMDAAPAELTWGLLLALLRRIPQEERGLLAGRWGMHVGEVVEGKVLGILGFGTIGRDVARYGQAFGMRVIASSRSLTDELATALGCQAVTPERLLRNADVVSLHLPLTDATRGTIGREEFGLMKSSAYLVNTARGALVDEAALVQALSDGGIRGAALDVYETEPLPPESPLRRLDNVVLTPHVGYVTESRYEGYYGQAAEIIASYLQGHTIRRYN